MKTLKVRLIKWWQKVLQPVTVGNNVTLPVPSVDRGRGDPRNLMCIVIDINTETQQYKLATRYGLLNESFSRNQFPRCTSNILLLGSVDFDTEISVRQAARKQSIGTGHGFLKCTCKSRCIKKICKCLKAGMLCNSRCHNSNTCFRVEDFQKLTNQKQELSVVAMFVNGSGQNEHSLQGTFHRCFLTSFGSFGQAVLEEKIFLNLYRDNGILNTDIYI